MPAPCVEDVHLPLRKSDTDGFPLPQPSDPLRVDPYGDKILAETEVTGGVAAGLFRVLHRQLEAADAAGDRFPRSAEMFRPEADDDVAAVPWGRLERIVGEDQPVPLDLHRHATV